MLPLLASLVALGAPAPAHATALVQIDRGSLRSATPVLRQARATEVAPELRVWRVPAAAVPSLRRAGVVQFSEPERRLAANTATAAAPPLIDEQWWRAAVGADRATPPGPGKPITIVDSGLDITHPEFAGRPNTTLLNNQTVRADDDDHGTEVASVIGAPGVGLLGVYPAADLRSWDASPNGFLSDGAAIQGILEAARRGPGVINLSFGGPIDDPLLEESILTAVKEGSLVVAASGNEGIQGSPESFPADYAHVLTVGATDEDDRVADFSTTSPYMDLAAPGVWILVAEPTFDVSFGYIHASGTSFSSPMVAGAAAWVWTARPDLDASQLAEVVRRSARDINTAGFDVSSGYGILDIPAALAMAPPVKDPYEPNDDADEVEPGRMFTSGTPALTTTRRGTASLTARVDRREDPHDFYRVLVPAGRQVVATTSGPVDLRIYRRSSRPLRTTAAATSAHTGTGAERASFGNASRRAVYVYVEVRPGLGGRARDTEYTLQITTAARR